MAILDLVMPKMGGVESLKEIKAIDQNTEVLIITGNAELNGLEKVFFDYGAVDYLLKPFDMTDSETDRKTGPSQQRRGAEEHL